MGIISSPQIGNEAVYSSAAEPPDTVWLRRWPLEIAGSAPGGAAGAYGTSGTEKRYLRRQTNSSESEILVASLRVEIFGLPKPSATGITLRHSEFARLEGAHGQSAVLRVPSVRQRHAIIRFGSRDCQRSIQQPLARNGQTAMLPKSTWT